MVELFLWTLFWVGAAMWLVAPIVLGIVLVQHLKKGC